MVQTIIVVVIFLGALFYLGRFIYRQTTAGKDEAYCDKCSPRDQKEK
jgi:uncharacterized membrane protein